MNLIKFQEWFYGLPIWDEIDNYIYFILAGVFISVLPFDEQTLVAIGGALIGGLIMKGKGKS